MGMQGASDLMKRQVERWRAQIAVIRLHNRAAKLRGIEMTRATAPVEPRSLLSRLRKGQKGPVLWVEPGDWRGIRVQRDWRGSSRGRLSRKARENRGRAPRP